MDSYAHHTTKPGGFSGSKTLCSYNFEGKGMNSLLLVQFQKVMVLTFSQDYIRYTSTATRVPTTITRFATCFTLRLQSRTTKQSDKNTTLRLLGDFGCTDDGVEGRY